MAKKSGAKRFHWNTLLVVVLLVVIGGFVAYLMGGDVRMSPSLPYDPTPSELAILFTTSELYASLEEYTDLQLLYFSSLDRLESEERTLSYALMNAEAGAQEAYNDRIGALTRSKLIATTWINHYTHLVTVIEQAIEIRLTTERSTGYISSSESSSDDGSGEN